MTTIGLLFTLASALLLLVLPRRLAFMPLVVATCLMTQAQSMTLFGFNFYVIRLLILMGLIRMFFRREWIWGGASKLDKAMFAWGLVLVAASPFHETASFAWGMMFNYLGLYVLFRAFVRDLDEIRAVFLVLGVVMIPLACCMLVEVYAHTNIFSALGGVPDVPIMRSGRVRAQGPFRHPIMAGTAGALAIPVVWALKSRSPRLVWMSCASCLGIVVLSASSIPILTLGGGFLGMAVWRYRDRLRKVLWGTVLALISLHLVMKAPVWYLMGRIDLTGGSTGWYRAELISQAGLHLNEWWIWGTDETRHWMPTGLGEGFTHTDITNHYIWMGIQGGLPLFLIFIYVIYLAFVANGRALRFMEGAPLDDQYFAWALGACLLAQAVSFLGVAYFDQLVVLLVMNLGAIGALERAAALAPAPAAVEASGDVDDLGAMEPPEAAPY